MRLAQQEVAWIKKSVQNIDPSAQIFIYGSRTQDHLSGGDIDLIVISEHLKFSDKLTLLVDLKIHLGDQKIDLTLCSSSQSRTNPFIIQSLRGAIQI